MRARLIALAACAILVSAPGASIAAAQSTGSPYYPGGGYAGWGYGYSPYGYPTAGINWGYPVYANGYPATIFDAGPLGYAGYPSYPPGYLYGAYPYGYPYGSGLPGYWPGYPYDYGYPGSSSGYPVVTPPSNPGGSTGRVCILIYPPPPGC
jgi:hypothetical protein